MAAGKSASNALELREAQIEQLIGQSRTGAVGALLGGAIMTWALWGIIPPWRLVAWFLGLAVLHAARSGLQWAYSHRDPAGRFSIPWTSSLQLGILLSGLWWGLAGVLLFPSDSLIHQFILALCVAGIASAATLIYSPTCSYLAVVLGALLPLSARFLVAGGESGTAAGIVVLLFATVLSLTGWRLNAMNRDSLSLRFEKDEYIESLRYEKDRAEKLFTDLEQEVKSRAQAEEKLRQSEEKYRVLFDSATDFMFTTDAQGCFTLVNPVSLRLAGYEPEELVGKHYLELVHPDHRSQAERFYGIQLVKQIAETYYEVPILSRDGREVWLGQNVRLMMKDGEAVGYHGVCRDISDRKIIEENLRRSQAKITELYNESKRAEDLYQSLLNSSADAVVMSDLQGRVQYVSPSFTAIFGWTMDEVKGKPIQFVPETERRASEAFMTGVVRDGEPVSGYETRRTTKGGALLDISLSASVFRDHEGQPAGTLTILRDITRHKRDQAALRESESRYRALVETARDVIWSAGLDLRYTYVSPAVTEVLGYAVHELTAMILLDTLTPASRQRVTEDLHRELELEKTDPGHRSESLVWEVEQYQKDGSVRVIEMTLNFLRDEERKATGILGISRDVTDRKRSSEELEKALATSMRLRMEAEAANVAKSQFLANMSHELRTPLNAIIGFSEVLSDRIFGNLNPQQQRYVNHILNSGHHLLQLVNEVLDLAKVESGKMELTLVPVDFRRLMEDSLAMIRESAVHKSLATSLHLTDDLDHVFVYTDRVKLKQVMFNLLSNAVKFTAEGGTVRVSARLDGNLLVVSVADTGIGIRPEDRERIFNSFEQVDSSYSRREQGTGLGLTLTRRLIELHGGRIWVESQGAEQGSTFTFTIPTETEQTNTLARSEVSLQRVAPDLLYEAGGPISQQRPVVLVVEDDEATGDMISAYLLEAGYSVIRAGKGEQAIDLARKHAPFAIALDVITPLKYDFDTLIELKRLQETRDIPVVLVTIYDDERLGLALGAVDLLAKSLDKNRLLETLRRLKARRSDKTFRVLIVDDDPLVLENLSDVLRASGFEVITATRGKTGIELAVSTRPDVLILDLIMPDLSGFEVIGELHGDLATRDIPIIVYTAKDVTDEDRSRLMSHVLAIALKSHGRQELFDHLNELWSGSRSN